MKHWRTMEIVRVMAVVTAVVSCSKGERASADTIESAGVTAQQRATRQLSGELTKPIDQYSGAELDSLVRRLTFTGGVERQRRCRVGTGCTGAAARTRLRVDAVADEDSLSPTALPRFGIIAARALNRGGAPDLLYGMRPGARYAYYLIVFPGVDGGGATWQLRELQIVGNTRTHSRLAGGRFVGCNHPFVRGAMADFRTCGAAVQVRPASLDAFAQAGGEPPLWIRCAAGCCTAE